MEHNPSEIHSVTPKAKRLDSKSNLMIGLGAVALILIIVAVANFGGSIFKGTKTISADEAKTRAEAFITKNLVAAGTTATVTKVEDYNSALYKLTVHVGTTDVVSFISKDGNSFYPQEMNINDINNGVATTDGSATTAAAGASTPVVPTNLPKTDKPVVELFIMAHCPYGTQIEKGMSPVAKALGDKVDYQIKFVNYAMHGLTEVQDNVRQYCIGTEQKDKYAAYLDCFLKAGDATGCMASTGIDQKKLDLCYNATDKKYNVMGYFNDKTTWNGQFPKFTINDAENTKYAVQGSPTMIINGKLVEPNRDPASLLATVCAAFKNQPAECKTKLDTATPAPGFGVATTSAGSGSAAACAPAT